MEVGMVQKVDIDDEMQQAYLDYAMSVIVARALPDARDGLKPVHRRILYAMYDMGMRPDSPYKKSARIVGEVLGKYHPHGDMAVYDAMARMAQDFSLRYLLVDGQGNFGSIDGDPPAAMRYTEARLQQTALQMLADIQKNTVDFEDNFDGTLREPSVLPSALPNFLVNGATGIAVGMSTSVPPHNLGEVVGALGYMLENWDKLDDIELDKLMEFVQGPDFPTGGVIIQEPEDEGLRSAYGTGRGRVTVQARVHLEEMDRGRSRIIVTELPYMTNKASLIERIASLVREERLEGIADLRDESDRQGMRIVIELSKTADPEKVLRDLYRTTPMKSTFSIILLALVDGEPRLLGLKQALRVYLEHRLEIVRRRSEYDLEKARHRAHILEGLRVALKNLDAIINLIRKAPDVETARERLMKQYKLTDIQAQAILDMQLRRLAALERKKIEEEYKEVQALIKELESLLRSPKRMRQAVNDELLAVKEAYGDARRTYILRLKEGESKVSLLTTRDLTPEKNIWIAVTPEGLISRSQNDKLPRLSGKEAPAFLVRASSRDVLYLANEQGETAAIAVHTLPEAAMPEAGLPFWKVSALREGMRLAGLFTWPARPETEEERFLLTVTRQGMVKKTAISELPGPSSGLFTLVKVNNGDRLGWMRISQGQDEVLLVTRQGMSIRFSEEEVRPMGWVAAGVMGMKLQGEDEVAGMELLPKAGEVFLIASDGSAKRVGLDEFPKQGRYGQGIVAWKLPSGVTVSGMTVGKGTARATVQLDGLAAKALRLDEAPVLGRTSRGKSLPDLKSGVQVVGLAVPWERPGLAGPEPETSIDSPNGSPGKKKSGRSTAASRKTAKAEPNGAAKGAKSGVKSASAKSAAAKSTTAKSGAKSASAKSATAKGSAKSSAAKAAPAKTTAKKAASSKAASTKAASAKASESAAVTPKLAKAKSGAKSASAKSASAKTAAPAAETQKAGKASKTSAKAPAKGSKAESSAASVKKAAAKPPAAKPAAAKTTTAKSAKAEPAKPSKKPAAKKPAPKQLTLPTAGETPPAEQPPAKKPRAKK